MSFSFSDLSSFSFGTGDDGVVTTRLGTNVSSASLVRVRVRRVRLGLVRVRARVNLEKCSEGVVVCHHAKLSNLVIADLIN